MNYREAMIDGSLPLDLPLTCEAVTNEWCMALHGNHDEHQCHKKPGHEKERGKTLLEEAFQHECYCGVWW